MIAKPTQSQLIWHDREIGMFIHFGLYCYRPREHWGMPGDPIVFNPTGLDASQWVSVAKDLGARYVVFTAKHADGFCLWRTRTTEYGVKSSPWKNGEGDVVREMSEACYEAGLPLGIYLSPADAHYGAAVGGIMPTTEEQKGYDTFYRTQLTELLTQYGSMCEVWFDGSCVTEVGDLLKQYAPDAMVFQSSHATIRWVGNEHGYAPYPAWNSVASADSSSGMATAAHGTDRGDVWMPLEVDTPIRDHYWMWEPGTDDALKSLDELIEIYYRSVGHGAVLLLNSNPNADGLIPARDAERAREFGKEIRRRFSIPLGFTSGPGQILEMDLKDGTAVDHVVTMEDIGLGERIRDYAIQGEIDGRWVTLATGSAVGHKKIDAFPTVSVDAIRMNVRNAVDTPMLRSMAVYRCGPAPQYDGRNIVIHDPFLIHEWTIIDSPDTSAVEIDIRRYCREARRYSLELRDYLNTEIDAVVLLFEGTETQGYVTRNTDGFDIDITAHDAAYSLVLTVLHPGEGCSSGKIYLR